MGFPGGSAGNESTWSAIPGLGRSPREGNMYPLHYSGLENFMDCKVPGVAKSWAQLSNFHFQSLARYPRSVRDITTVILWFSWIIDYSLFVRIGLILVYVTANHALDWQWQTSIKDQIVNVLGCATWSLITIIQV